MNDNIYCRALLHGRRNTWWLQNVPGIAWFMRNTKRYNHHHHHHHHVHEGLGVFPVPWSSRWSWSLHLFLGRPMFLRPFGLYCSACFGSLFMSIIWTCCSHFSWYCFISFTMFCAPVFSLIHWFFPLSSFVIPRYDHFKLNYLQNSPFVQLYNSTSNCKGVGNITGKLFVKTFSALPSHS